MSGYKFFGALLLVMIFESVAALECYECLSVEKCEGDDKNRIIKCDRQSAQMVTDKAVVFFPKLHESVVNSDKYQCTSLVFTAAGANTATSMLKGCIFETTESLCRLEAQIPNGNFSCHGCNTDKCNSGVTLGWNFLLLLVGLAATRMVK